MSGIMQWSYSLAIRAKSAAGSTIATYYAGKLEDGKAVAIGLELAFSGRRLIQTLPDLAPASWGTAV